MTRRRWEGKDGKKPRAKYHNISTIAVHTASLVVGRAITNINLIHRPKYVPLPSDASVSVQRDEPTSLHRRRKTITITVVIHDEHSPRAAVSLAPTPGAACAYLPREQTHHVALIAD